jgi:hypothetical protein
MEEIFQLCDEITILRDGQWIATQPLEGLDMDKIIAMMVGRSLNQRFPDKENKPGEVILKCAISPRCVSRPSAMSPSTCTKAKSWDCRSGGGKAYRHCGNLVWYP